MTIFTTRIEGPTLILEVHGPVSSLADDSLLKEVDGILAQLRQGRVQDVVVDFGQSPYFGSSMLETLRRVWNELNQRGGRMVVCNVSMVGSEILQVSKFDQLWPIVATRNDAEQKLKAMS
jgi:anti-anti-sigma factor